MTLYDYLPGMAPGAPRRNVLVILLYLFAFFLLVGQFMSELLSFGLVFGLRSSRDRSRF